MVTKPEKESDPYMTILSEYWKTLQVSLFPRIELVVEEAVTEKLQQLLAILDIIGIEKYLKGPYKGGRGRRAYDRRAIARAFIAKAVYNVVQTKILREMLLAQSALRTICGYESRKAVPSEAVFSRAFAELAEMNIGDLVHMALVQIHVGEKVVMHISRDSTEIAAREKPAPKPKPAIIDAPKRKRGRSKKGETPIAKEPTRIEKQVDQTLEEALSELPLVCDVGAKRDAKGRMHSWIGYKAHIDWADGGVPITVLTTSASLHDSQVAIPMARLTAQKVTSFYDLMDAAYDADAIRSVSESLGHVAIIDANKRRVREVVPMEPCRAERYKQRTTAERGNSRLKDEFGFRFVRVRGKPKVHLHLMFGILALFADQVIRIFSG